MDHHKSTIGHRKLTFLGDGEQAPSRAYQQAVYNFMNQPSGWVAAVYHVGVLVVMGVYAVMIIMEDRDEWMSQCKPIVRNWTRTRSSKGPDAAEWITQRQIFEVTIVAHNAITFGLR